MFRNVMELSDIKVRECMIPRTEIVAINQNDTGEVLKNKFIETGLSKILIYDTTIDNIIGYVHVYDILKFLDIRSDQLLEILQLYPKRCQLVSYYHLLFNKVKV